ncbi:hypothetical protein [Enterobacter sp. V87_3]|uniref:hypothetical protein n=1 Tax=Enterobacter sp. V87_3 TaxID=3044236 RepID=UPI00249DA502|nr:hypothetical protein [Enterobacter sp. V87_3]MDI3424661.1 hypothetical protein [Enterobacter sp. V87_3]
MNDVLVFGGGYDGHKRSTTKSAGTTIEMASHPVQSTGDPEIQPISYIFDLKTFWNAYDGREYLYAVNGTVPSEEAILISIRRHKPNPIS